MATSERDIWLHVEQSGDNVGTWEHDDVSCTHLFGMGSLARRMAQPQPVFLVLPSLPLDLGLAVWTFPSIKTKLANIAETLKGYNTKTDIHVYFCHNEHFS